jgi:hypothetical protein
MHVHCAVGDPVLLGGVQEGGGGGGRGGGGGDGGGDGGGHGGRGGEPDITPSNRLLRTLLELII